MTLALGKRPARNAVSFKFATYFDASSLPTPPLVFGRPHLVTDWGLFANDDIGDCVWAGAAHETMLWRAMAGLTVQFTDKSVLADYSAVTGYSPRNADSDQGTDMQEAAAYRQKTGIADGTGARHKIAGYVALKPGNMDQLALAAFLFGAAGIGIELPSSAFDQFDRAEPFSVVDRSPIEGGHYLSIVGRNSHGDFLGVTWGRLQAISPDFLNRYMDEGIAYVSAEMLTNNVSPRGMDYSTLQADLAALKAKPRQASQETAVAATQDDISNGQPDADGELMVVKLAVAAVVGEFSFRGIKVGSYVTDEEITQVAVAAIKALDSYRNSTSI